jgi:rhodanese-related sulfurtransferase
VLDGGFKGGLETGAWTPRLPVLPAVEALSPEDLAQAIAEEAVVVIDLAPSPRHRKAHVPGAWFAIRAQLPEALDRLPKDRAFVLTSTDGVLAALAAPELEDLTDRSVRVLAGGTEAWIAAGRAVEGGLTRAANAPTDIYKRPYEGTDNAAEAMQAYLDWEFGLVEQLARDGTHGFYVI